jgi:hypothetical protein
MWANVAFLCSALSSPDNLVAILFAELLGQRVRRWIDPIRRSL